MPQTDGELVERALAGDRHACQEIVERYQRMVFNIAYHYLGSAADVEDLAQEVFLRFFRSLGHYDRTRPLKVWIGKIAANRCLDELRRRKVRKEHLFSQLGENDTRSVEEIFDRRSGTDVLEQYQAEKCLKVLRTALNGLNERDRMAFVLREIENLDYVEIARMMSSTQLAVRVRVSRAKKALREQLARIL